MSTSRIPTLLEPYLDLPPPSSLVLLTGVLGASANWLVLRWLYALLKGSGSGRGQGSDEGSEASTGVVLVSFLRDSAFWKEGSSKLVSLLAYPSLFRTVTYMHRVLILRD
jgi:elongator complex protein 6